MKAIHALTQGTDPWREFRLTHFGASEAAAMLGLSPKMKRSELLRMKHTGLPREFSDWLQANVLDVGHEVEALARPHMERLVGEELFQVTLSDGRLSASCDGVTMLEDIAAEHKGWNETIGPMVAAGQMPPEHMPQCQQVLMITGAERLLFMVSDGTPQKMAHLWVFPDPEWFQRLRDGWAQFEKDLAAYTLQPRPEPARAEPMDSLPAVSVRLDGALSVVGNLPTFAVALRAFIAKMPTKPATDNEFATCDAACKALKKAEDALDAAEAGALASIADVDAMRRAVADCRKLARETRLAAEKMVERRKVEIKEQAVLAARLALDAHVADLNGELAPMRLLPVVADFAGAIKGLRSFDSMRAALDTRLAEGKIAADAQARVIRGNLAVFKSKAAGLEVLFADLGHIVHKAADDFAALVDNRIATHRAMEAEKEAARQAAEAQRIAAAEQRAREQEAARIAAEQEAREREQARQTALAEAAARAAMQAAAAPAATVISTPSMSQPWPPNHPERPTAAPVFAMPKHEPAAPRADEPATLKLGAICERLGFTMTAAFVETSLGIKPARLEGAARLYRPSDFARICAALKQHIERVSQRDAVTA